MIELDLAEAGTAMGCRPSLGHGEIQWPPISTDSRTAGPEEVFFALQGEHMDGHDFISRALEKGVRMIVHSKPWKPPLESQVIALQVADTTRALQDLAALVRTRWNGQVVAIAGSMGKTTTRHFAAAILAEKYRVHQSPGNLNNHIGLPLSLLALEPHHQVALLELGMNHRGEIRRLAEISRPHVGLITNVAPAHLEFFSDLNAIAEAKGELLEELVDGTFIYNADDSQVSRLAADFRGTKQNFGFGSSAAVRILNFELKSLSSMDFELGLEHGSIRTRVPFVGRHFLYNIAAAAAVAQHLGLTSDQILKGIGRLQPPKKRGKIFHVVDQAQSIVLWDDSYNANPQAVQSVLRTLADLPVSGRRVAVLGDMLELGSGSQELHREIGEEAAANRVDLLLAVGPLSRATADGAIQSGLDPARVHHFMDAESAGEWLAGQLMPDDFVLVKGSRGIATEIVVDWLTRNKEVVGL